MALLVDIIGHTLELGETTVIGRDPDCRISVSDSLVSRFHSKINKAPNGQFKIVDLGSLHGTYVAGKKVTERILCDGDEIIIGATRLRFYERSEEAFFETRKTCTPEDEDCWELESYPMLESIWSGSDDFLAGYDPGAGPGRFFHPLPPDRDLPPEALPGALLLVVLRFLDREAPDFHIHARVLERKDEGSQPGLRLEFLAEERKRQELVLACAEGESIPHFRRRHPRVTCRLPALVSMGKGPDLSCTAADISEGGVGLFLNQVLRLESIIQLAITFPNRKRVFSLKGRVASVVPRGPRRGAGIEFKFESPEERDEMADLVALLRSRGGR